MPSGTLPPSPTHIIRGHGAQLNTLTFSEDNEKLYSGDSSGHVTVTSTRTLRPLVSWRAHIDGILGIEEWNEDSIITHGRDNKLHFWTRLPGSTSLTETAASSTLPLPSLMLSMDVNALNYCRFSILPIVKSQALIALPNLLESSLADIWTIPSVERLHARVGSSKEATGHGDGRGQSKSGIIMSMHLFKARISSNGEMHLKLLIAYENGGVSMFVHDEASKRSVHGEGWSNVWTAKAHTEPVMAMAVDSDNTTAFTVSADNLVCRYILEDRVLSVSQPVIHRTKYQGNGAIAIRDDGRVMAIGGWDGKIRLYSTKSFKSLGTLSYHKEACYAIAFANYAKRRPDPTDGDDSDEDPIEGQERWLVSGGKDQRICVWKLIDFEKYRVEKG